MSEQLPEADIKSRRRSRAILGIVVSGALLAFVSTQLNIDEALSRIRSARLDWLLAAFGGSCLLLVTRALRFFILTERASAGAVLSVVALQNFLNRVTPFRLGELSLPYYLQRVAGESAVRTLVSLLLVRLLELWLVIAMAAIALYLVLDSAPEHGAITLVIFVVVLTIVLASFGHLMVVGAQVVSGVADWFKLDKRPAVGQLMKRLEDAINNRARLTSRQRLGLLFASLAVVLANQFTFDCILRALHYELSFLQIIIGVSATQIIGVLPLPTVGSMGSHEAGWTAGFVLAGVSTEVAVMTGIVSQFTSLFFNALLAIPAYLHLNRRNAVAHPKD
ncbi:MAG: lysylphosphatidylglycerol synthase transmembrane domain-containing protein [Myxococcota bacterium]|nr:lysylphosphatidylglycerol synthase transmembrane domain-containing protein [Myxococcota bacterium]